jgi:hypothetical protein
MKLFRYISLVVLLLTGCATEKVTDESTPILVDRYEMLLSFQETDKGLEGISVKAKAKHRPFWKRKQEVEALVDFEMLEEFWRTSIEKIEHESELKLRDTKFSDWGLFYDFSEALLIYEIEKEAHFYNFKEIKQIIIHLSVVKGFKNDLLMRSGRKKWSRSEKISEFVFKGFDVKEMYQIVFSDDDSE